MTADDQNERACPYCAETIKAAAVVCKHCGRDLPDPTSEDAELAGIDRQQLDRSRVLGISRTQKRWVWRGNYFTRLDQALAFAEAGQTSVVAHEPVSGPSSPPRKTKWWVWPIGAVGLFMLYALLRTPGQDENAKMSARAAIRLCWQDQERKSIDPATARFVAGACEKMERDFRARFGVDP